MRPMNERILGKWAVGINNRIGRIESIQGDRYIGACLDGGPWWTRAPLLLDDRDQLTLGAIASE